MSLNMFLKMIMLLIMNKFSLQLSGLVQREGLEFILQPETQRLSSKNSWPFNSQFCRVIPWWSISLLSLTTRWWIRVWVIGKICKPGGNVKDSSTIFKWSNPSKYPSLNQRTRENWLWLWRNMKESWRSKESRGAIFLQFAGVKLVKD